MIGPHTFTVEAHLTNYPVIATPEKAESGILNVGDPCPDPNLVEATAQMTLPDYYYTPDTPVIFTMNPFEVHPPTCPAIYECTS